MPQRLPAGNEIYCIFRRRRGPPGPEYCRGVRFEQRLRDGIHSGAIVLAFRRWKRSQVVAGRRYRPGTVSTVLAEAVGWGRQDFKLQVRRLKELGLTFSLDVGYRLSPRGESYPKHLGTG